MGFELAPWVPLAFFCIAFAYAMAGLGGGSGYLAVLVLAQVPFLLIPQTALFCNVIVSLTGLILFSRAGALRLKLVLPFAIASIPMAYVGGSLPAGREIFSLLLGLSLFLAALRMVFPGKAEEERKGVAWSYALALGIPVGGALGFLSGLVGIGGGIFLSPFLIFMRWAQPKEAAAASAFFIVVNSLAGLTGHLAKGPLDFGLLGILGLATLFGGALGSWLGAYQLNPLRLRQTMAAILVFASARLLLGVI